MLVLFPLELYLIQSDRGLTFTPAFYNLSYAGKSDVARQLLEGGYITPNEGGRYTYGREGFTLYDRLVKALLQHSPRQSKLESPVRGERKQRPEAKAADRLEALYGLYSAWEILEPLIITHVEEQFQTTLAGYL